MLPLPQRGAHSPAQPAARSLSSRPSQRAGSFLSPLTFAGGSAASPPTPPAATVHTRRLWSRTHSPSLTHTARPRLLSGPHIMRHSYATCCVRARARANLARGSRRRGGENVGACGGTSKRSWEMKFRVSGPGKGGEIPVSTSPANWLVGFVVFSFNVTCCVFIGCFQKRKRKANEGIDLYKARLATAA